MDSRLRGNDGASALESMTTPNAKSAFAGMTGQVHGRSHPRALRLTENVETLKPVMLVYSDSAMIQPEHDVRFCQLQAAG